MLQRRTDAASWQGTSPPAQPRDEGACPGKLLFIKGRNRRIAAIARRFKRRIDLSERDLAHGGVLPPFGKDHQHDTLVAKAQGPIEWHALARVFLQRLAIGDDRLFELRRPALALPEERKRTAQTVLGHGPIEWHALKGTFLQRPAIRRDALFHLGRPALAPAEARKRTAQTVLGHGPIEWHALARVFLQRLAIGDDRLFELRRPALALPEE